MGILKTKTRNGDSFVFTFFRGFSLFSSIPQDFFPAQDRNMFRVSVELPINSTAEETERSVYEIRKQILKTGVVESDVWFIGRRLPRILYNVVAGDSAVGIKSHSRRCVFCFKL